MTTPQHELDVALAAVDEFRQNLAAMRPDDLDASVLERRIQGLVHDIGRALMQDVLARADTTTPEVRINGTTWGARRVTPGTYMTLFGEVTLPRSTYAQGGRGRVAVPLELRLGIVEDRYTPTVARAMAHAIAVMTSDEAAALFDRVGVCQVSRATLHRVPHAIAARFERERQLIEAAVRAEDVIPADAATVQVALDGVMVPQDGEHAKARGRVSTSPAPARHEARYGADPTLVPAHADGHAGRAWQEASVGTLSFWDRQGEHLRTIYLAQMPEAGKQTLCEQLAAELQAVRAERADLAVCVASDGAPQHWVTLSALANEACANDDTPVRAVLDFFHAAEYLTKAANVVYGEGTAESRTEAAYWRTLLREHDDGASRVLKALRYQRSKLPTASARAALESVIAYLAGHHHAGRMAYAQARAAGAPIGTGVTEAAAKTLVSVRMKRAGARYSQHGGQTILLFRSALLSDRFTRLCHHLERTYTARVEAA